MDKLSRCQQQLAQLSEYNYELELQIQTLQESQEHIKNYDHITDIFNSCALIKKLKKNENRCYILLNMDNFQNINNAYGFETGNELLQEIVKLLILIKPTDFELYRFYADKFVLLSDEHKERDELMSTAESILSFFNASEVKLRDDILINLSFSIGISTAVGIPAINQAELALKEIRKSRSNYYYIYDQKLQNLQLQQETVYWIEKIRNSILDEEMIVHFQAIMNNKTMKIEKYECLARIEDEGSIISPYLFMEAASLTRVLHLMTQSVINQAFKKFANTKYEFSINITMDDLFMDYLEPYLLKYCAKYNISPSRVVLEILEDISSLNEENILNQLESLRMNGFQIAIDDFGAEKSNFSRLLEFKPDYLKIDGAFIKNIIDDKNSRLITESIVYICKKSNIKVIAEFIHSEEVLDVVKEIGIDYSQGYFIGAPSTELVEL